MKVEVKTLMLSDVGFATTNAIGDSACRIGKLDRDKELRTDLD